MNINEFYHELKVLRSLYNFDLDEDINIIVKTNDGDCIVTNISKLDIHVDTNSRCGLDIITEEVDLDG